MFAWWAFGTMIDRPFRIRMPPEGILGHDSDRFVLRREWLRG